MENKVIVIVGPTAVGKTKLGVELAKKLNGEVISGDSMQIYKKMDIGTAKVTSEETQGIKHHLIDIKDFKDSYSVSDFQYEVRKCIKEIHDRNKTPIIVGGTGLYIKAALYDYTFNEEKRTENSRYDNLTNQELFDKLKEIDLESAKNLHPNNRRRVLRAIEIFEQNGKTKSAIVNSQTHTCLYDVCFIGLTLPRELLYKRINLRVDLMFEQGLLDEFNTLLALNASREDQSMKAIGYKELFDLIENKTDLETTKELIKQHSRQYAKRQYTWFKNQMDIHWIKVNLENFNQTVQKSIEYIKNQKYYRHLTVKYHNEDLSDLYLLGVEKIKIGHSEGEKQNPTYHEIITGKYNHLYLADIYYNEQIIETKKLLEKLNEKIETLEIVQKKEWNHNNEKNDFEKFYELKEV